MSRVHVQIPRLLKASVNPMGLTKEFHRVHIPGVVVCRVGDMPKAVSFSLKQAVSYDIPKSILKSSPDMCTFDKAMLYYYTYI